MCVTGKLRGRRLVDRANSFPVFPIEHQNRSSRLAIHTLLCCISSAPFFESEGSTYPKKRVTGFRFGGLSRLCFLSQKISFVMSEHILCFIYAQGGNGREIEIRSPFEKWPVSCFYSVSLFLQPAYFNSTDVVLDSKLDHLFSLGKQNPSFTSKSARRDIFHNCPKQKALNFKHSTGREMETFIPPFGQKGCSVCFYSIFLRLPQSLFFQPLSPSTESSPTTTARTHEEYHTLNFKILYTHMVFIFTIHRRRKTKHSPSLLSSFLHILQCLSSFFFFAALPLGHTRIERGKKKKGRMMSGLCMGRGKWKVERGKWGILEKKKKKNRLVWKCFSIPLPSSPNPQIPFHL